MCTVPCWLGSYGGIVTSVIEHSNFKVSEYNYVTSICKENGKIAEVINFFTMSTELSNHRPTR